MDELADSLAAVPKDRLAKASHRYSGGNSAGVVEDRGGTGCNARRDVFVIDCEVLLADSVERCQYGIGRHDRVWRESDKFLVLEIVVPLRLGLERQKDAGGGSDVQRKRPTEL